MTTVVMADCAGLWRRTLLIESNVTRDADTEVMWLQGITTYVDSRGFAGRLSQRGEIFEWQRMVDLEAPSPFPDAGRMRWDGGVLVENGVHVDYVEHWVRADGDKSPCWGLTARGPTGDEALLVRVGDAFGWAASSSVIVGVVGGSDWQALNPHVTGRELRADGGRWKITTTEGVVNL